LRQLRAPVVLYGGGWGVLPDTIHDIHPQRVPLGRLAQIYHAHPAVLNIRNETHVLAGLN
jgi:cyanophycinase-like exopeptidase